MASATEERVWKALSTAHARMAAGMEDDLRSASGLSLKEHQLLAELSRAAQGALRMHEIADLLVLTPSGVSRLVDRLQAEGLVERLACPSDRRGFQAHLTDAGRTRLRAAQDRHAAALRRHFGDLPCEVLERLADSLEKVSTPGCQG